MPRKAETAIPLAFRVPNPPATFVGREPELRAFRAAAKRGSIVVLCGLAGLGKTSLALAALKKHMPGRLRAAVIVAVRDEPLQQTLVEILRALASVAGRRDDWSAMAPLPDLLALALDLAEENEAVVVLDDLHHGGVEMLLAAARYARRSLWIATSRVPPTAPELAGQIVSVGPLPDGKLAALARMLAPRSSAATVRDAVRAASGSPLRLRTALTSSVAREAPLSTLDASAGRARAVLETLAVAERSLERDALERLTGAEVDDAIGELARRGLVEVGAGGVRLNDAAAASGALELTAAARTRVAHALASSPREAEVIEGLRVLLALGDTDGARALCERRGASLLRAGYAPTLWRLLAPLAGWESWKLRAAVQLATVDVPRTLPRPEAHADRLLWIRALLVGGSLAEADAEAAELAAASTGAIAFWAGLLRAMAVHHREDAQRALVLLRALAPPDANAATLRDVLAAFWLAECGDPDAALALLANADAKASADAKAHADAGAGDVEVLGAPIAFFTRYYRMAALMECGRLDEAYAAMTLGAPADLGEDLAAARVAGNALANLAIARGHLGEARTRLDRLARASSPAGFADVTTLLGLERRIAAGELGGIEDDVERLARDTRTRTPLVHAWCTETRERVAALFARPCDAPLALDGLPLGPGTRNIVTLRRALREARWGNAPSLGPPPRDIEGAVLHAMATLDPAEVARAVDLAARHGWAIRELEARALLAELRITMGADPAVVHAAIAAFEARAAAVGSPRFVLDARLLRLVTLDEPDAPALEALADAIDVAPVAARRARAILGGSASLDALDTKVVAASRFRVTVVGAALAWRRGWGLDLDRKLLWREDGTTESLARHALYVRILETLATHGGSASFEDLARDAWNVRSFHPLQDGNRLRVTMHRIRSVVGSDRIVLRGAGYALSGPPFRVVSRVTSSAA